MSSERRLALNWCNPCDAVALELHCYLASLNASLILQLTRSVESSALHQPRPRLGLPVLPPQLIQLVRSKRRWEGNKTQSQWRQFSGGHRSEFYGRKRETGHGSKLSTRCQ